MVETEYKLYMENELMPCPVCGSPKADYLQDNDFYQCKTCGFLERIKQWNTLSRAVQLAASIVRCGECKYYMPTVRVGVCLHHNIRSQYPDDFCNDGEREVRDGEEV